MMNVSLIKIVDCFLNADKKLPYNFIVHCMGHPVKRKRLFYCYILEINVSLKIQIIF